MNKRKILINDNESNSQTQKLNPPAVDDNLQDNEQSPPPSKYIDRQEFELPSLINELDMDCNSNTFNRQLCEFNMRSAYSQHESSEQHFCESQPNQSDSAQINFEYIRERSRALKKKGNNKYPYSKSSKFELAQEEIEQILNFKLKIRDSFIDEQMLKKQVATKINGMTVYFPYEPYNMQVTYMKSVIQALKNGQNALLQSPTGTGKTLCLLSSTLSWIYSEKLAGRHRKVIYLSRTHTQLSQMQKQLKKTCFKPTMSYVGSRDHFCIKPQFDGQKGRQKMQSCSKAVKLKISDIQGRIDWHKMNKKQKKQTKDAMCDFYSERSVTIAYGKSHYANTIWQIQDFLQQAKDAGFCPYYYPFHMDLYCDFFIMPYNYILDFDLLPRFSKMIQNGVLIFDQAHNVAEASCEGRSYDIYSSTIKGAQAEIHKILYAPKVSQALWIVRANWSQRLQELLKYFQNMYATIFESIKENRLLDKPNDREKRYYGEDNSQRIKIFDQENIEIGLFEMIMGKMLQKDSREIFMMKGDYYQKQIKKFQQKILYYNAQIEELIEQLKQTEDGIFHHMEKTATFWKKASDLISLSFYLKDKFIQNQINHYRLMLKITIDKEQQAISNALNIKDFTVELRCLVPWLTFQKIVEMKPRSIIFTSGTMAPLDSWERELNITAPIKLINTHVIKEQQVRLNVLKTNLAGKPFDFRYQAMQMNSDEIYQNLIETIFQISKLVPHGMLVVCPNFKILRQIRYLVNQKRNKNRMKNIKAQIFQERGDEKYIEQFKVQSQNGAILYCVCRGRASEGIDFPDHHCRAVVFVGIPFPNISDPILIERKQHFQNLENYRMKNLKQENVPGINWEKWYFNGTIRAINQSLGRLIRHSRDYGMLFLLDKRYSQNRFQSAMPGWAKMSLAIWDQTNQKQLQTISKFYARNEQQFKSVVHKPSLQKQVGQDKQELLQKRIHKKPSKQPQQNSLSFLNAPLIKFNEPKIDTGKKKYTQITIEQYLVKKTREVIKQEPNDNQLGKLHKLFNMK